jgi:cysteine synthase
MKLESTQPSCTVAALQEKVTALANKKGQWMNFAKNNRSAEDFAERARANQQKLAGDLKLHYDFVVCGAGTSGNTMAPCVVIGERAAEFLQNEHRLEASAVPILHGRENKFESFLNGLSDLMPGYVFKPL